MPSVWDRLLQDRQLAGLAARTQESYLGTIRRLTDYSHKAPELLTEEDLRHYFLYLRTERRSLPAVWTGDAGQATGAAAPPEAKALTQRLSVLGCTCRIRLTASAFWPLSKSRIACRRSATRRSLVCLKRRQISSRWERLKLNSFSRIAYPCLLTNCLYPTSNGGCMPEQHKRVSDEYRIPHRPYRSDHPLHSGSVTQRGAQRPQSVRDEESSYHSGTNLL
jgi:hypothetical protein